MVTRRDKLPSMTALQVLLAVAERGYTTAAAESMNLSQSAVSKQLLGLEELVGSPVFTRTPKGMVTTDAGRIYVEQARAAIKAMEDAALQVALLKPDPKAVRLQVLPIFGDRWLLPNFADFTASHPDIDVQFTSLTSRDRDDDADGMFTFGTSPPDGAQGMYLFGKSVLLVGTASYLKKLGNPTRLEDFGSATMLEHPHTPLHWSDLAATAGNPEVGPGHTVSFGYYTMVIRAALAGQGVALIPRGLILEDLQSGRLVNPNGLGYKSKLAYWFSIPQGKPVTPALQTFVEWLKELLRKTPIES